jgi:hypothetical protein
MCLHTLLHLLLKSNILLLMQRMNNGVTKYVYNNIFFILKVFIVMCISHHTNLDGQITNYFPFFNSFKDYL